MSSVKGDYCNVGNFTPSQDTKLAIAEMNRIIDMAHWLQMILSVVPFFQIFVGRDSFYGVTTAAAGYQITTSDWQTFADALSGVNELKKERLRFVVKSAEMYSMGEERKFWECVSNAI